MTRPGLPQDYVRSPGELFEDFSSIGDWNKTSNSTISANSSEVKTGTGSIKFRVDVAGGNGSMWTTINRKIAARTIKIWFYLHTPMNTVTQINFYICSTTDFSKYFTKGTNQPTPGWNSVTFARSEFSDMGTGDSWDNTMIKLQISIMAAAGENPEISFDSIFLGYDQRPMVMIHFDDGRVTDCTEALPIMDALGQRATSYIIPAQVGAENYMSEVQLGELYEAGWALGNHTYNHTDLTTLSQPDVESQVITAAEYLNDRGWDRASRHVSYPIGAFNDTVAAAMDAAGMITGRTTIPRRYTAPLESQWYLPARTITSSVSLASAMGHIDSAIESGSTAVLLFHGLGGGGTEWSVSNFAQLMQYIDTKRLSCVTIDEWYEGLTNPRYRSTPVLRDGA